jgi:hypothetical protein
VLVVKNIDMCEGVVGNPLLSNDCEDSLGACSLRFSKDLKHRGNVCLRSSVGMKR